MINSLEILKQQLLKMCDCRVWDNENNQWILHEKFQKEYDVIEKWISNNSLELKELKVGMWIWDNDYQMYNQIIGFYSPTEIIFRLGLKVEYKRDRFYLRQKQ